jgi:MFS family permease
MDRSTGGRLDGSLPASGQYTSYGCHSRQAGPAANVSAAPQTTTRWWRDVTAYQWLVFSVAAGAWLFDNLDQRLFSLARIPALKDLMGEGYSTVAVQAFAKQATALFLVGWGIGGLVFGALGDRFGRVRVLTITILIYSIGTGLTTICHSPEQFALLRFMTGIGIGGVFGLAVAIVAETVSGSARLAMLALLQVSSTVGNIAAALIKMAVDALAAHALIGRAGSWRWLFAVGTVPALLAVASGCLLRESDAWLRLRATGQLPRGWFGAYAQLLSDREERHNLVVGSVLAVAGVVGLWAIGEYAVDLQDSVFTGYYRDREGVQDVAALVAQAKNQAYLLQMIGGALGMAGFSYVAARFGRRPAFVLGFAAAFVATLIVYGRLSSPADAYWMMPLMGAAQLSVFAGFAIYLPELFSARARGTGVSFAYNLGRFAAAGGSYVSALLTTAVFGLYAPPAPFRYSAMVMCGVFLVGLIAAIRAPETRGRELKI